MSLAFANEAAAARRTKTVVCGHWDRLAAAVEKIFPKATAKQLSHATGLKVRACFKFLARESSLSSDALVALLDTAHGPEILRALLGDSKELWWLELKLHWDRERVRSELDAIDRAIAERRAGR